MALDATSAQMLLAPGQLLKLDEASIVATVPRTAVGRDFSLHSLAAARRSQSTRYG